MLTSYYNHFNYYSVFKDQRQIRNPEYTDAPYGCQEKYQFFSSSMKSLQE
jgi:hypothetical protein